MLAVSIGILVVALGALALAGLTLQAARQERAAGRDADRLRVDERRDLIGTIREQANQLMYLTNHPWETPPHAIRDIPETPRQKRSEVFAGVGTLIGDDELAPLSSFEE